MDSNSESHLLDVVIHQYGTRRVRSMAASMSKPRRNPRQRTFASRVSRMTGVEREFWEAVLNKGRSQPTLAHLFDE